MPVAVASRSMTRAAPAGPRAHTSSLASSPIRPPLLARAPCLPARKRLSPIPQAVRSDSSDGAVALERSLSGPNNISALFVDPLVRTFLLGLSAGVVCEAGNVALKALNVSLNEGLAALPQALDHISPMFALDHVAAIGSWALLFLLEAMAVWGVLRKFKYDPQQAASTVSSQPTLAKRMLPIQLPLKHAHNVATVRGAKLDAAQGVAAAQQHASAAAVVAERPAALPEAEQAPPPGKDWEMPKDWMRRGGKEGKVAAPTEKAPETRREKELRERKGYLKNFWYAAALSQDLDGSKPLGVDILGMRVALFRDAATGQVQCIDDTCPHRGAPLSAGWVSSAPTGGETSCLVCPYHGWAFDGDGRLRDVPSAEEGRWPARPIVSKYPVKEQGGFVWLFYGDADLPADERPPIPDIPELHDPNWRAVYGEIEFKAGHWPVFENAIDMAHIHYLHNDSFGNADAPKIHDMKFDRHTFHVEGAFRIRNKPVNPLWNWTKVPSVPVTAKAMLPSTSAVTITLGGGVRMITFVNTVPIDENRATNRFCLIRNLVLMPQADRFAKRAMFRILGEDKVMVEKLRADLLEQEYSLGPDAPQTAFRKLRQEYVDLGYLEPPRNGRGRGCSSKRRA